MPHKQNKSATDKNCFVMMPISDVDGYPSGHFEEVYHQLIKPAVESAGYSPTRADEIAASNLIHIDVVSRVVSADLCICDLSTRNPNVMFEYGIRQAFDKPTVLIKDSNTPRIFDLSGFRDIEYDWQLRVGDIMQSRSKIASAIASTIKARENEGQVFSLVSLLGLANAAQLPTDSTNPESAQFQILAKQINSVQEMLADLKPVQNNKFKSASSSQLHVFDDGNYRIFTDRTDYKVKIIDRENSKTFRLSLLDDIPEQLKANLSKHALREIQSVIEL